MITRLLRDFSFHLFLSCFVLMAACVFLSVSGDASTVLTAQL